MDQITFPMSEWDDVKARLDQGKVVFTVRVDQEVGKYHPGDVLKTEWGQEVRILSVQEITGGIDELKTAYPFFDQLTEEMLKEVGGFQKMEIITLQKN